MKCLLAFALLAVVVGSGCIGNMGQGLGSNLPDIPVFEPVQAKSISGFGSVALLDFQYAPDGRVRLYVENRAGGTITVTQVIVGGKDIGVATTDITLGQRAWITGTGIQGREGGSFSETVAIQFTKASQSFVSSGTITGTRQNY